MSVTSTAATVPLEVNTQKDRTVWWIGLGATVISIAAYVYFFNQGVVLGYKDAMSHLQIAQRVVNSPTPGFAQLGGVWLPLQHILMLPVVWIAPLYYSGFAGSVISMLSFVVACMYLYKIVLGLTSGARVPAVAGVLVFALNPNILYMQSTPMGELLFFAAVAAMAYHMQAWIQTDKPMQLMLAALAGALSCLTRYEAWLLTLIVFTAIVVFVSFRRYGRQKAEGSTLMFAFLAWAPAIGWIGWNWLILGDPLNFQSGEYAKPSLWVDTSDPSLGHPLVAIKTYWYALVHDFGLPIIIVAAIGIIALVVVRRNLDTLPILSFLSLPVFFSWAIWSGTRPMNVMETSGNLYNLRFGLVMGILAAVAIGYLVSLAARVLQIPAAIAVGVLTVSILFGSGLSQIVTIQETQSGLQRTINIAPNGVSDFLRQNYDGGKLLQESFGNETILFDARVSLGENIYEGSYQLWEPALKDPAAHDIRWIVMRGGDKPDKVYIALHGSPQLDEYALVFSNDTYQVYKRK